MKQERRQNGRCNRVARLEKPDGLLEACDFSHGFFTLKLETIKNNKIRIGIPLQREDSDYCCYDGKVFGCETFKYIQLSDENNRIVKPDSIYNKSLEDIYYHSEYLKHERKFVEHQMALSGCGEKCPVQRKMRRVVEI